MPLGLTAKSVMDDARVLYLNDPSGAIWTDAKLLPKLKVVYGFLQTALERNGVQCKSKISDPIVVTAGLKTLPVIPSDLMWPVKMEERLAGSPDLFVSMVERRWSPQVLPTDKLIYWNWNYDQFAFVGATTNREVLLYYWANFPALVDPTTGVLGKASQYMSAKLAAGVHTFDSQNMTLGTTCDSIAESNLDEIIGIYVKKQLPVRRKPYVPFR